MESSLFNVKRAYRNMPWLIDPVTVILQYYTHLKCEPV